MLFQLPCGTVSYLEKFIPLALVSGGFVIEAELNADTGAAFDVSSNAANWDITDVSMLATIHTIDSSLANSYAKHILSVTSMSYHT